MKAPAISMPNSAARIALWAASICGLLMSLWSVWVMPPPVWVAALAFVGYVGLILTGVFKPELGMYAYVVSRGPRHKRQVALTFDDGPHPKTTRQVLQILEQRQVKATFFVVGYKVEAYPEVVREIVAQGHTLGLHSYHHDRLLSLRTPKHVVSDIERTQAAIEKACGKRPTLFRPPVGFISPRTAEAAKRANVTFIGWSARGFDGARNIPAARLVQRIEKNLEPGAIVLLHDAAENEDFTPGAVAALPDILDTLQTRNLKPVTVEELLEHASWPETNPCSRLQP